MTIIQTLIFAGISILMTIGIMVFGGYLAVKLISKGMVASGNSPIIGNTSGDAFSITDGTEPIMPGLAGDEKKIHEMAAGVLKSFGKMGGNGGY